MKLTKVVRYVGGLEIEMILPSGREVTLKPNDTVDAMPHEASALLSRDDFEEVAKNERDDSE